MQNVMFTQVGHSQVESTTAMTRDSHASDRGRLVGGATHRLEVKPVLAVKTASKQSQKHRLGVGGWTV